MRELKGISVVNMLNEKFAKQIEELKIDNIIPKLAVVRVGDREDDIAYEKNIIKRFSAVNATVEVIALSFDVSQSKLEETISVLNNDKSIHGIILLRPLPKHLSLEQLKVIINKEKDVDCMGLFNTSYLFEGNKKGHAPCTPQAVVEILDYYDIDVTGKNVVIIGRSLVVGKPLAMLLLEKNATVTICHTKTVNLADVCKRADILIACVGVARMINNDYVHTDQVVIDVGINMANGKLCGDVDFELVSNKVKAITPVPGGVGMVTTSILLKHTIYNAMSWKRQGDSHPNPET